MAHLSLLISCLPSSGHYLCLTRESSAAVKAYGKVSDEFPVTDGVWQGCVLALALFNLYFDIAIHMALDEHRSRGMGIKVAYLHDADLVGKRKTLRYESLVTDMEYADDMAPLSDNWVDLTIMLDFLSNCCKKLSLAISCKKTKTLADLPSECSHIQTPVLIHLVPGDDLIEEVSYFQYLDSIVQNDCGSDTETCSRIC